MTNKEKDLLVSILNYLLEELDYNVDEVGFGYDPNNDTDICCLDDSLEEGLQILWNNLCKLKHK